MRIEVIEKKKKLKVYLCPALYTESRLFGSGSRLDDSHDIGLRDKRDKRELGGMGISSIVEWKRVSSQVKHIRKNSIETIIHENWFIAISLKCTSLLVKGILNHNHSRQTPTQIALTEGCNATVYHIPHESES